MRHAILLVCLLALILADLAQAQETGGSMGGADFSSGGDGGGSSSSDGSGAYSSGSDSGPYTSSQAGASSSEGSGGLILGILVIVVVFMLVRSASEGQAASAATDTLYLSSLMLGIDWHARGALQQKLAALAAQKLGGTAEGRVKMLHEVALALTRAELSWLYVAFEPAALAPSQAESRFLAACNTARSRFRREVIRNEGSELTTEEPGALAVRPEEGAGMVVVSLILVTRRPLSGRPGMRDAAEIRGALAARTAATSADLVAVEVVWSPAAEDDRMSTSELEQHYPELVLIDPKSIAGRLFCPYCGGAFAMELLNCPHCGAAVADSKTHEG